MREKLKPVAAYAYVGADDRRWWVEDYGVESRKVLGPRCMKVTDLMSPTGYYEWVAPEQFDARYARPNLYAGVPGLFTSDAPLSELNQDKPG